MTIDQLNKLTDEEVRVRVALALGWSKRKDGSLVFYWVKPDGEELPEATNRHKQWQQLPDWHNDLNEAFTLVEKLRGEGCGICIYTTSNGTWQMYLRRHGHDAEPIVEHPSLARAIALAFLAVAEREEG